MMPVGAGLHKFFDSMSVLAQAANTMLAAIPF
jgi:preprotein translocase subunit Sec61beta